MEGRVPVHLKAFCRGGRAPNTPFRPLSHPRLPPPAAAARRRVALATHMLADITMPSMACALYEMRHMQRNYPTYGRRNP